MLSMSVVLASHLFKKYAAEHVMWCFFFFGDSKMCEICYMKVHTN